MPYSPQFTITNSIASALTQIERLRGFLEAAHLSEQWIADRQEKALTIEAHHTTHIEGTQLSFEESERLLRGEALPDVNLDDRQELLNYRTAFDFVSEYLNSQGPITQGLVREIHRHLVAGVRGNAANPGEYRKVQNYVVESHTQKVIYTPPPAFEVPRLMSELTEWLQTEGEVNPILIAGLAQLYLVDIHPFLDGNGRTARLLSSLCLYRSGYDFKQLFSISEYYDRGRPQYYQAIQATREGNRDLTSWLEYFTMGLATQLRQVESFAREVIKLDEVAARNKLSRVQHAILELALNREGISLNELVQKFPDSSKRTLQRELKQLLETKLLLATGATTKRMYHLNLTGLTD